MISLLLPSRNRSHNLSKVIQAIANTVSDPRNIELLIRLDDDDEDPFSLFLRPFCKVIKGPRPISKVVAYNELFTHAKGDIIMPLGDDSYFTSKGWDEIIEHEEFSRYSDKILLLYGRDGVHDERLATHWIISRKWAETVGYYDPPFFKAYFGDTFMHTLAKRIGRLKYRPDIVIEHRAAHVGKGDPDKTFNDAIPRFKEDRERFLKAGKDIEEAAAKLKAVMSNADAEIRLGIGIPLTYTHVPVDFFFTFAAMEKPNYVLLRAANGAIDAMRNNLVMQAKAEGCTHLIMMDTDMTYHPETIPRLLSHKLPAVGALCYRRYPPFDPLMYRGSIGSYLSVEEWKPNELVEVDATGTGCILFDMKVFEQMPAPWFKFRAKSEDEPERIVGEDVGFCSDLKAAGYKIFVDTSVPSGHLSTMEITEATYRFYKNLNRQRKAKGGT